MFHRTLLGPQLSPHFSTSFPALAPGSSAAPLLLYASMGPSTATLQGGLCFGQLAEQSPLTRRNPQRSQPVAVVYTAVQGGFQIRGTETSAQVRHQGSSLRSHLSAVATPPSWAAEKYWASAGLSARYFSSLLALRCCFSWTRHRGKRERVCSHFGSSRRPTLWLEFPLTFSPFKVCLCRGDQRVLSVSMVPDASNVSKDGWSSVPYGWTCGHSSHERLWFSSKCYRRCGAPEPNGSPSAPLAAAKAPRRDRKRGTRPMSKPSTLPEVNLAKVLDELKENEHFQCSEELAMQAKVEQAWEAEKHQKLQSAQFPRPSKTARLRWRRRKAAAEAGGGGKAKSCTNYKWKLTS